MKKEVKLTLVRHGQSQWNLDNRFTGWVDVPLTQKGITESIGAGKALKEFNIDYTMCFTSVLKRAIHTSWNILNELELAWLPQDKAWQLNERHYGALQGLNKQETKDKYGEDQVQIWRRSYDTPPPKSSESHHNFSLESVKVDRMKYDRLGLTEIPDGESLKTCQARVLPFYEKKIKPLLKDSKNLLVVAHGNSLRSLIMELEGLSKETIMDVEIETGVPVVYTLNTETLEVVGKVVLRDQ